MSTRSEEDIRAERIAAMEAELGELHFRLWKNLTWLHFEWNQYRDLFGTHPSRFDIINGAAPRFFWSIDRVLWQDILLSISRLADSAGSGGQQNLTFERLLPLLKDKSLRQDFVTALNNFEDKAHFARDWRHKLFAHRHLDHALSPNATPLAHASRGKVEEALKAARDLMDRVESHYIEGSFGGYEYCHDPIGGANDLLMYLDRGLYQRETARETGQIWRARFQ